jgi:xanthine dehydrogenase FAD-binding subunit
MNLWHEYLLPKTLDEAMQALASAPRPLAPIAGGTDLLLDLEQGRHYPVQTLVDITEVKELLALEIRVGSLFVGAGVPVNRLVLDLLTGAHAQALVEACNLIGGPQVRNVATLGGNVAHALPAADGTIALLALNAEAEIASITAKAAVPGGNLPITRRIPLKELFLGPGKSVLKHGEELLVGFYLPLVAKGQASCFKRIMRPQGVALPIINLAIWLERADDKVSQVRVAVGPGGPTPWRATDAEQAMIGKPMNNETSDVALEALLAHVGFRSSPRRANADYRRHLVTTLFRDTLTAAWERAE